MYQLIFTRHGLEALLRDASTNQEDTAFLNRLAVPLMRLDAEIRTAGKDACRVDVREAVTQR